MNGNNAQVTAVGSAVDLTKLTMHRGNHLNSARQLNLPGHFTRIFYASDDIVFGSNLSEVGQGRISAASPAEGSGGMQYIAAAGNQARGASLA